MDRLEFLRRSAYVAAGTIVGATAVSGLSSILSGCAPAAKDKIVGLQLYSLRDAMGKDVPGTMKKVADFGYKALETANYSDGLIYGMAPADFRKLSEDLGMKVTSSHLGCDFNPENAQEAYDWWTKAFDAQAEVGCTYAIQPFFPGAETLEELKVKCDYFNKLADMAKSKGLQFGFHNHDGEFRKIDDQIMYDYMLQNTSNDVVFEMDVYWVSKGGYNPVDYLKKYKGRFPLVHIKDESIIGESGELDFESIFNAAYEGGMKDYYVEVERYTLPAENCVQRSYDFLALAPYVK